ncbi:MAG: DUF4390 domain-containing protein [Nitrosomonas sp.]|nr:DUF4390 domain-containing protein [Nitrosomonas sp.]MCP5252517.1 DUF4390 domain-containing protein [Burkholderiales bacterium]
MMVFFTPYCRSVRFLMKQNRLIQLLLIYTIVSLGFSAAGASANGGIQVHTFKLEVIDNDYFVSVDSEIALNPTLEQALKKGVVLYFVTKFTLVEPRWYWLDNEVARLKTRIGLRYSALTRQYQLSDPTFTKYSFTLKEALQMLQRLHRQQVTVLSDLSETSDYHATLRLWLDLTRMPKPFQVEALGSSAWNLSSERVQWRMKLPSPGHPFQFSYQP